MMKTQQMIREMDFPVVGHLSRSPDLAYLRPQRKPEPVVSGTIKIPRTFPHHKKEGEHRDPLKVSNWRRSVPGILVFNDRQELIFFNNVALALLSKSNSGKPHSTRRAAGVTLPKEISDLLDKLKRNPTSSLNDSHTQVSRESALISRGDTNYCCLAFFLYNQTRSSIKTSHTMILIGKISEHRNPDLGRLKKRFQLTERQMMIVKQLFSGLTNKEIADRLYLCEDTIKGHLKHIMKQLGVKSRAEIFSVMMFDL